MAGQPQNLNDPWQQPGYGFPLQGEPAPPAAKKNQKVIIGGAVVVVLVVVGVVVIVMNSVSGSSGTSTNAARQAQTQSCAAWKAEAEAISNQNPNTEADLISTLDQDLSALRSISRNASASSFKTDMSKVVADYAEAVSFLRANPALGSTSTPPAQFFSINEAITKDESTLDSTCGLRTSAASGGSGT